MTAPIAIGSLFSGIGGLELGLARTLGAAVSWQVEQLDFPRAVLAHHFPEADRSVTDVRQASAKSLSPVELICGGFPCQDISPAGKGAGLTGARSGLAWEFLRVVEELAPRTVVLENSFAGWRKWVPQLRRALHHRGFTSLPLRVSAGEVGAPHRRARCFLLAHSNRVELRQQSRRREPGAAADGPGGSGAERLVTVAHSARLAKDAERQEERGRSFAFGKGWGTPPPGFRRVDDGVRPRLDRHRLHALGNAVVPQAADIVAHTIRALGWA